MVRREQGKATAFGQAIKELRQDKSCIPLVRQAMIAGWNYSLISSPELVAGIWNQSLPKALHVTADAFVDKGQEIEWLTADEMKTIVRHRGGTLNPMKEGFDPFYQWKFIQPDQSVVKSAKNLKWWSNRTAVSQVSHSDSKDRGYGKGRYTGD